MVEHRLTRIRKGIAGVLLYLMGYRGTGKSTVGRCVAEQLGLPFVDVDKAIEAAANATIAEIFADVGEVGFRQRESAALAAITEEWQEGVIALGGGAVLKPENQQQIRDSGRVVWLRASVATICSRIAADAASQQMRPALQGKSTLEEVDDVLRQREPIYAEMADVEVTTDKRPLEDIASEIASWWRNHAQ